jgi:hypothetical protein
VLSPVNRNEYLENAKDLKSEVKLWQTLKLTYFIAEKKIGGKSHSNTNIHLYSSIIITITLQK